MMHLQPKQVVPKTPELIPQKQHRNSTESICQNQTYHNWDI